jgi:hypothetical protein
VPTATCPVCDAAGDVRAAGAAEATHDTFRVLATGIPMLRCPDGHEAIPDVVVDAVERACDERFTTARRPRLLGRHQRCGACGADLVLPGFRTERVVTVQPPGLPSATLVCDVPLLRCPDCAVENLPVEVRADLTDASLAALAAAAGA